MKYKTRKRCCTYNKKKKKKISILKTIFVFKCLIFIWKKYRKVLWGDEVEGFEFSVIIPYPLFIMQNVLSYSALVIFFFKYFFKSVVIFLIEVDDNF